MTRPNDGVGKRVVNAQEAKTNLSKLLREVEGGAEVAIAGDGGVHPGPHLRRRLRAL
ncbi:MAG: hypothetical protein EVA89_06745 [Sandaracinaceae bacterium]|nr:MAG: hypothetical protein EVA89_06745 [Sandaracinaceae bacterium]HBQ16069.1 hypothetical protein [Myxococcales bacterium]